MGWGSGVGRGWGKVGWLGCSGTGATSADNVTPSILSWYHHAPVSKGRVVEDIRGRVIVVVSLRRQYQAHSIIHDARQSLHEELGGAHHVGVKDC